MQGMSGIKGGLCYGRRVRNIVLLIGEEKGQFDLALTVTILVYFFGC